MTSMLDSGMSPEDILHLVLDEWTPEINDTREVRFYCSCNKSRVEKVLLSVGKDELESMISDGKPAELVCHFCGEKYEFSIYEIKELLEKAK